MQRAVFLACNLLAVTTLVGCAMDGDADSSEEDAIADAAAPGKADSSFPLGFYSSFDIDYEDNEPLHAVFHEDGQMDFSVLLGDSYETRYSPGTFKVYKWQGRDRLRLTDQSGKVVFRGDWGTDEDGDLQFGGETWLQSTPDATNVANCIAMTVVDTSIFEEGFTPYEYPDFQIEKDGAGHVLSMGAGSLEASDGYQITVTEDAREILAVAVAGDERIEVEIPKQAPKRGIITFSEEATAPQHHMADIVCR
jgi:hypothetical protein